MMFRVEVRWRRAVWLLENVGEQVQSQPIWYLTRELQYWALYRQYQETLPINLSKRLLIDNLYSHLLPYVYQPYYPVAVYPIVFRP